MKIFKYLFTLSFLALTISSSAQSIGTWQDLLPPEKVEHIADLAAYYSATAK